MDNSQQDKNQIPNFENSQQEPSNRGFIFNNDEIQETGFKAEKYVFELMLNIFGDRITHKNWKSSNRLREFPVHYESINDAEGYDIEVYDEDGFLPFGKKKMCFIEVKGFKDPFPGSFILTANEELRSENLHSTEVYLIAIVANLSDKDNIFFRLIEWKRAKEIAVRKPESFRIEISIEEYERKYMANQSSSASSESHSGRNQPPIDYGRGQRQEKRGHYDDDGYLIRQEGGDYLEQINNRDRGFNKNSNNYQRNERGYDWEKHRNPYNNGQRQMRNEYNYKNPPPYEQPILPNPNKLPKANYRNNNNYNNNNNNYYDNGYGGRGQWNNNQYERADSNYNEGIHYNQQPKNFRPSNQPKYPGQNINYPRGPQGPSMDFQQNNEPYNYNNNNYNREWNPNNKVRDRTNGTYNPYRGDQMQPEPKGNYQENKISSSSTRDPDINISFNFNPYREIPDIYKERPINNQNPQQIIKTPSNFQPNRESESKQETELCKWRYLCEDASDCRNRHSDKELQFFKINGLDSKQFIMNSDWKRSMCSRKHNSEKEVIGCKFSHNEEDSYCDECKKWGHCKNDRKCR